jgi:hypothetical protein
MTAPEPITVITRVPIPSTVSADAVLDALRTYEALITPNPFVTYYEPRQLDPSETADPFFPPSGWNLAGYTVCEHVPIIPYLGSWATKAVYLPCVFQSFEHGVRCCAHAQVGVTVRSSYEVRKRGEVKEGPPLVTKPGEEEEGEYELVDISRVTCNALVRPFVKMRLSDAHQKLMKKLVAKVKEERAGKGGEKQQQQS